MQALGKILVISGILLVLAGLVIWFGGNKLSWLGRLPGDIRIERGNFRFYVPITTMILVSILLSLLIRIFQKFMH